MLLAGGGAVVALAGGNGSDGSSSQQQYCPPNSPGAGQPQGGPGNNCGTPGTPGNPNAPGQQGNQGNQGNRGNRGNRRRARVRVHRHPRRRCYRRNVAFRISVSNKGRGKRTHVYRNGRRIKSSASRAFKVRINVRNLRSGVHTLTIKVRGKDGRLVTRRVRFRRC